MLLCVRILAQTMHVVTFQYLYRTWMRVIWRACISAPEICVRCISNRIPLVPSGLDGFISNLPGNQLPGLFQKSLMVLYREPVHFWEEPQGSNPEIFLQAASLIPFRTLSNASSFLKSHCSSGGTLSVGSPGVHIQQNRRYLISNQKCRQLRFSNPSRAGGSEPAARI